MPTEIITRAEAIAKGLTRYFTDRISKNHHLWQPDNLRKGAKIYA